MSGQASSQQLLHAKFGKGWMKMKWEQVCLRGQCFVCAIYTYLDTPREGKTLAGFNILPMKRCLRNNRVTGAHNNKGTLQDVVYML